MKDSNYKIFAVVSEPRTGSTVISHKLGLLNGVACQGEIFHPDKIFCSVSKESIPSLEERNKNPIDFLHKVIEQTYEQKGQSKLIGFKLFFDHNPAVTNYIAQEKVPVILLERTNKLAQYSSLKIAKKTGQWHSKQQVSKAQEELNRKRGKKVRFSLLEFVAFSIRSRYRFHSFIKILERNDSPYYYVAYEKIFGTDEWENIVNYLGIEIADINVETTLEKQNKGSLLTRFSNNKYVYFCCKLILVFPVFSEFLSITPSILVDGRKV